MFCHLLICIKQLRFHLYHEYVKQESQPMPSVLENPDFNNNYVLLHKVKINMTSPKSVPIKPTLFPTISAVCATTQLGVKEHDDIDKHFSFRIQPQEDKLSVPHRTQVNINSPFLKISK